MNPLHFSKFVQDTFQTREFIPLHEPVFKGNELKYINETIKSTFVSSVGEYVNTFEENIAGFVGVKKAVATVNGTSALHLCLHALEVDQNCEVITQALSFVATANAIIYTGAAPIFLDVNLTTRGLCPDALSNFLEEFAEKRENGTYNKTTGKKIAACIPMHTFGFMTKIEEIVVIANAWNIPVIEDASEALGSSYQNRQAGSFGKLSAFSFNGNKIITAGGGGVICSDNEPIAQKIKHLSTTAKEPHPWEFYHNEVGFNYRMPNLNAALVLAQLESFNQLLLSKKKLYKKYKDFFKDTDLLLSPPKNSTWNHWLICLQLANNDERVDFLERTNANGVMTRPIWQLLYRLPMFKDCFRDDQTHAQFLEERIVNIPSSAKL
jgi:perosamine synthetase